MSPFAHQFCRLTEGSYKILEICLLPVNGSWSKKIILLPFQIIGFCLFFPISLFLYYLNALLSLFVVMENSDSPLVAFSKKPVWKGGDGHIPLRYNREGKLVPIKIGFSTSDIQDSGPHHPQYVDTNWGTYYEKNKETIGSLDTLPDTMNRPEELIARLRDMGINYWRTSINLLPKKGQSVDKELLKKYCSFFRTLNEAGIELMITLNHNVSPNDFDWTDSESTQRFISYVEEVADPIFQAGVRKVLTTNEQAVGVLQGYVFGAFPPHKFFAFKAGCKVMENMMKAHLGSYQALKKIHPEFQVSLVHDPIRFHCFHKRGLLWAPLEKIICHYLTEITHSALMRFFQTGVFTLKIPLFINYRFEIKEFADRKTRPLDFFGLNFYTDPLVRLPHGSVSEISNEKLSGYGYRMHPQGIASVLEEINALNVPIDITEVGVDAAVNHCSLDLGRIAYFNKLFQATQKAIDCGVDVRSVYIWTLNTNWEWCKGFTMDFNFFDGGTQSGVATWLKDKIVESKLNFHLDRKN